MRQEQIRGAPLGGDHRFAGTVEQGEVQPGHLTHLNLQQRPIDIERERQGLERGARCHPIGLGRLHARPPERIGAEPVQAVEDVTVVGPLGELGRKAPHGRVEGVGQVGHVEEAVRQLRIADFVACDGERPAAPAHRLYGGEGQRAVVGMHLLDGRRIDDGRPVDGDEGGDAGDEIFVVDEPAVGIVQKVGRAIADDLCRGAGLRLAHVHVVAGMVRPPPPEAAAPSVKITTVTGSPASTWRSTALPQPRISSSGWGARTKAEPDQLPHAAIGDYACFVRWTPTAGWSTLSR